MKHHNPEELFKKLQKDVDAILHDFREYLKDDPREELVEAHFNVDMVLENNYLASLQKEASPAASHQYKAASHSLKDPGIYFENHSVQYEKRQSKGAMKKINSALNTLIRVVEY